MCGSTESDAAGHSPGAGTGVNMRLGILSDTHNLLRGEVLSVLEGVDCILHAGDICRPDILEKLETIAPVYAVRGNADKDDMGFLPEYMDQHLQKEHLS